MNLKEQLNADLKAAMKSGADVHKSTLRMVLAALRQAELDKRAARARQLGKPDALTEAQLAELEQVSLSEEESLDVVQKEAKARREAMADAEKAGRADLVLSAQAELKILEGYLPQALAREELVAMAQAAIAEAGAADPKQAGAVMKILAPRVKGRADGRLVNDIVRELLGR